MMAYLFNLPCEHAVLEKWRLSSSIPTAPVANICVPVETHQHILTHFGVRKCQKNTVAVVVPNK